MRWWLLWRRAWRRRAGDEWGRSSDSFIDPAGKAAGPSSPYPYLPGGARGGTSARSRSSFSYGRPGSRWLRRLAGLTLTFVLLFGLFGFSLYTADRRFRPSLQAIGEMKAKSVASQAVNEALSQDVFAGVRYDQLMDVKMDAEGKRILLLQANGAELARIAGRAQRQVWERLTQLNGQAIRVPLAQVFGWSLFGNWGPTIPVTFHPIGAAVTDIRQVFQSGGINQTQHIIYAHTEVTIRVLVPLVSKDVVVNTNTFITAAVLNGEVPSFYLSSSGQSASLPPVLLPGTPFTPEAGGTFPAAPH